MVLESVGQIIAIREFGAIDGSSLTSKVRVLIGKPEEFPEGPGYYCPFQISGVGPEDIKYAVGIDSVQALQLVMVMIGATLEFYNQELGGVLRWEGSSGGDFGFPSDT
jgi:Domain of unknown function (DUF6968)